MQLINMQWQPLPGAAGAQIYPYIRKPGVESSNSYIIKTAERVVLIDPGAIPAQMEHCKAVIQQIMEEKERPVLILLTHCHVDHWHQIYTDPSLQEMFQARVATHEIGVRAIEERDDILTMATILGRDMPEASLDIALLSEADLKNPGEKTLDLGGGNSLDMITARAEIEKGITINRQIIDIGDDTTLQIYHTPGHTPDSITIAIGKAIFPGDFFIAVNNLVRGMAGWNQDDLLESIRTLFWLVDELDVGVFCTAAGSPITRDEGVNSLNRMLKKTSNLTGLIELNHDYLVDTSNYAIDLLTEINHTLSIIAGRLYYAAYYLEYLGENEESERYNNLVNFRRIDELLDQYHSFADAFESGKILEVSMILKASQVLMKIEKLFEQIVVEKVLDQFLLKRAMSLYDDFMHMAGGLPLDVNRGVVDLNELIHRLLEDVRTPPFDDSILEALDNQEEYLAALVSRITFQPVFKDVTFEFQGEPGLPLIDIDQNRFCDVLFGLMEEMAALEIDHVRVKTVRSGAGAVVMVDSEQGIPQDILTEKRMRLYQRKTAVFGGKLTTEYLQQSIIFRLELPAFRNE